MKYTLDYIRLILATAAMLCITQFAYADDGYFYYGDKSKDKLDEMTHYVAATKNGNKYTATIPASAFPTAGDYYIAYSSSSTPTSGVGDYRGKINVVCNGCSGNSKEYNIGNTYYTYVHCYLASSTSLTIEFDDSAETKQYTLSTNSRSLTVTVTNGEASPSSTSVVAGQSVDVTLTPDDGYSYSSHSSTNCTVVRNGNVFTVTPSATGATLSITCAQDNYTITASPAYTASGNCVKSGVTNPVTAHYGDNISFEYTVNTGYKIDLANTSYSNPDDCDGISLSGNTLTISGVRSSGTLTVAFASVADVPVVNFGDMPVQSQNEFTLSAYVEDLNCNTVNEAGFYWGTSIAEAQACSSERKIAATTPATISSLVRGGMFTSTDVDLTDESKAYVTSSNKITTGTDVFFMAYVSTNSGANVGYSDVVGFFYNPCHAMASGDVTISPSSVALPADYGVTFETVARGAGSNPDYTWYYSTATSGDSWTEISNEKGYQYEMPANSNYKRVKVEVLEHKCQSTQNAIAAISSCAGAPVFTLKCNNVAMTDNQEVPGTPWAELTFAITDNSGYSEYEWVLGKSDGSSAVISNESIGGAKFRGPAGDYTLTYKAKSNCTGTDIEVKRSVKIKVTQGEDICN